MIGLVDELRRAMGCRPAVEIREVPDLATPATAGWRRPMLLLPDDWRAWDESERRAVVAHELAHVVRGDYAAGLLARLAVVLNYYHPLVRWMAGPAPVGAGAGGRRAGGPVRRGAGELPRGPLGPGLEAGRAVPELAGEGVPPGPGDLDQEDQDAEERAMRRWFPAGPGRRPSRLATALGLLALTIGVATSEGRRGPTMALLPVGRGEGRGSRGPGGRPALRGRATSPTGWPAWPRSARRPLPDALGMG